VSVWGTKYEETIRLQTTVIWRVGSLTWCL